MKERLPAHPLLNCLSDKTCFKKVIALKKKKKEKNLRIISDICCKIDSSALITTSSYLSCSGQMSPQELFLSLCKDKDKFTFQSMREMLSLWCHRQSLAITKQKKKQRLLGTDTCTDLSIVHVLSFHVM